MPKRLPYMHVKEFLGKDLSQALLAHAIASEAIYTPSRVGMKVAEDEVDERSRISRVTRELGRFEGLLQRKLQAFLPEMMAGLGIAPFKARERIELELAAHGDGAFYKPHIDMRLGETADRVVSAVYYMHAAPRAFEGGELRLFPVHNLPGDDGPVDIPPDHDSLLVFPSYARHEVRPVICPGSAFRDYRFAVNCWVHKARDP